MNCKIFFLFALLLLKLCLFSQNLISNSSFTYIKDRKDKKRPPLVLKDNLSEVKNWYIPNYLSYDKTWNSWSRHHVQYFSSRDINLIPMTQYDRSVSKIRWETNSEQLFENNLGFLLLSILAPYDFETTIVQQKLNSNIKKGNYCFKIKYKHICRAYMNEKQTPLQISFSNTNLKEYYKHKKLDIPKEKVQIILLDDSVKYPHDENAPWQNYCSIIKLIGDERYLTIGELIPKKHVLWNGRFYIDDVELYSDTSQCNCEKASWDLTEKFTREFALDTLYEPDSLVFFRAFDLEAERLFSPQAKTYINNVIAFMQRNPKVKIKMIERFNHHPLFQRVYSTTYINYMFYYGIAVDRIKSESIPCIDTNNFYCNPLNEYVQIGFEFYYE